MVGMSGSRFMKFFKQATGTTFVSYVTHVRLAHACELLRETDLAVGDIAARVGLNDHAYFDRKFKQYFNTSPRRMRTRVVGAPHRMTCTIGTTSYGFRYQLLDERDAPPLPALVRQTRAAGLDGAADLRERAAAAGDRRRVARHPARRRGRGRGPACRLHDARSRGACSLSRSRCGYRRSAAPSASCSRTRAGQAPSRDRLERFLAAAAERVPDAGMTLVAREPLPRAVPVAAASWRARYPPEVIAFCVDSANSLRNWESAEQVFDLLDERAAFYHLKDYRVRGSNVGFEVTGAPLGEGALDLADCVARMRARHADAAHLPRDVGADDRRSRADMAEEADWLVRSRAALQRATQSAAVERPAR